MMLVIGYFAEPSAPDLDPANLMVAKGHFATHNDAIAHARSTAGRLHARSFVVNFPNGTAELQLWDGKAWKVRMPRGPKD